MDWEPVTRPGINGLGFYGKSGCNGNDAGMHWQKGIGGILNFTSSGAWPSKETAMEQWELTGSVGVLNWLHCGHHQAGVSNCGGTVQCCSNCDEIKAGAITIARKDVEAMKHSD